MQRLSGNHKADGGLHRGAVFLAVPAQLLDEPGGVGAVGPRQDAQHVTTGGEIDGRLEIAIGISLGSRADGAVSQILDVAHRRGRVAEQQERRGSGNARRGRPDPVRGDAL